MTEQTAALPPAQARVAVPFDTMVKNLFKTEGYYVEHQTLVHAAIGVLGETVELFAATERTNAVEEMGDLEFYFEAALQTVQRMIEPGVDARLVVDDIQNARGYTLSENEATSLLMQCANDLLDHAKKLWVYGKPVDRQVLSILVGNIGHGRWALRNLMNLKNISHAEVVLENQMKLGKRYPQGVYADADAQARADKPAEQQVLFTASNDSEGGTTD